MDCSMLRAMGVHCDLSPVIGLLVTLLNSQLPDQAAFSVDGLSVLWDLIGVLMPSPIAFVCDVVMKLWGLHLILISVAPSKSVLDPGSLRAQCGPSSGATSDLHIIDTTGGGSSGSSLSPRCLPCLHGVCVACPLGPRFFSSRSTVHQLPDPRFHLRHL